VATDSKEPISKLVDKFVVKSLRIQEMANGILSNVTSQSEVNGSRSSLPRMTIFQSVESRFTKLNALETVAEVEIP
jgi:hypothetical protein